MSGFYNAFDMETLEPRTQSDFRSIFQIDRDRILHSLAFRRLQNKTQVFVSGDYDFYRTRLTHSLEVAQIGKSVVNYLNHNVIKEKAIDADLVEGICLSHDIGNPAYGHAGEARLNALMRDFGGFEGNAQTLKIIAETIHETEKSARGMKPSRAFVDGIMKYKILWSDSTKKGKFLYDSQKKYLDFIYGDSEYLMEKSLECQIMEWSDDIAYSLHDLSDGYIAGFINEKNIYDWATENNIKGVEENIINLLLNRVERREKFDRFIARRVGDFVSGMELVERHNAMSSKSNRYKYGVLISDSIKKEINVYKRLSLELVFQSPIVQQLEYKGQYILKRLFNTLLENEDGDLQIVQKLLPAPLRTIYAQKIPETPSEKARFVCDYIASQTDRSIVRIYKRLFDPDFGSLVDLV